MHRYGLIFQIVMAVFFAVMALIMGVVLLSYLVYIDVDPRMSRDLPFLMKVAGWFSAAGAFFALGSWSYWRGHWSRWLVWIPELVMMLALLAIIRRLRGAE